LLSDVNYPFKNVNHEDNEWGRESQRNYDIKSFIDSLINTMRVNYHKVLLGKFASFLTKTQAYYVKTGVSEL
jgi:hypothetical protein